MFVFCQQKKERKKEKGGRNKKEKTVTCELDTYLGQAPSRAPAAKLAQHGP